MIGSNTMTLNQRTVVAAVQMYLDAMCVENRSPLVKSVKAVSDNYGNPNFEVSVEGRDPPEPVESTDVTGVRHRGAVR